MNYKRKIMAKLNRKADENPASITPIVPKKPCRKSEGVSFEEWYKRLNRVVEKHFGLSMEDFADWRSRDSYEGDSSIAEGFRDFRESQDDDLNIFGSYKKKIIAKLNRKAIELEESQEVWEAFTISGEIKSKVEVLIRDYVSDSALQDKLKEIWKLVNEINYKLNLDTPPDKNQID